MNGQHLTKEATDMLNLLISSGKKIEAIKYLREITGWGLTEAKNFIDHYNPYNSRGTMEHDCSSPTCKSCGGELNKNGNVYVCEQCGIAYNEKEL